MSPEEASFLSIAANVGEREEKLGSTAILGWPTLEIAPVVYYYKSVPEAREFEEFSRCYVYFNTKT